MGTVCLNELLGLDLVLEHRVVGLDVETNSLEAVPLVTAEQ